jgi:hypothetical protein
MHTHAPLTEAGIKAQAQLLKTFLQSKNAPLNHMTCLDAVSVQYGYPSWQHARAALAQYQAPTMPPPASVEEHATQVGNLIVQLGAVHKPALLNFAQVIFEKGPAPTYTALYTHRGTRDGIERFCRLSAQQPFGPEYDLTVSAQLRFDLRLEGDVLYLEPTAMLDVGSESEIDWQCYYSGDEYPLRLSDPAWKKKLQTFVEGIPVENWVQQELEARGTTLKETSARFGQILFGR